MRRQKSLNLKLLLDGINTNFLFFFSKSKIKQKRDFDSWPVVGNWFAALGINTMAFNMDPPK